tara:strand:+ start:2814 stop:9830 length:7017 start_codon:yes stop_codon:yes gene_type:complete
MALRVFNLGELTVSVNSNENTPTTPVATTETAYTNTNAIISAVYPDDTAQESIFRITSASNLGTEYSNLEKTEGNILKVYDSYNADGIDLSSISASDLLTDYYFVMIHSDNSLKHHFARITSIHTSDAYGDSIKFEPSLGNEITYGVKFKLFKGPAITSDFKAIGLGISGELQNKLNISRPYYWFKPELKNQLEHNTKYFLRTNEIHQTNLNFLRLDTSSTPLFTTFLTNQGYSGEVKDYGKFTLKTKLIDNLRTLDTTDEVTFTGDIHATNFPTEIRNITGISSGTINDLLYRGINKTGVPDGTYVTAILGADSVQLSQSTTVAVATTTFTVSNSNESHVIATSNFTDYETSFFNARRDGDDLILPSSTEYTSRGSTRYIHYDYSNDKVNYTYNVMDLKVEESIKGKTSFSEVSIADMMKIYPSKLDINSSLRTRQRLSKSKLHSFVDTKLVVGPNGSQIATNNAGEQVWAINIVGVINYFTLGEEIKIEDRLYVIKSITTNDITLLQASYTVDGSSNTYSRLETESSYSDIGTPSISIGDKIYRRAYSPFNKSLINSFDLIADRHDDLYLVSTSKNSIYNFFKCTSHDFDKNLLTFTVDLDKYLEEGLHLNGDFYLYYENLNGTIEVLDYYRQDGQSIMKVEGRDIMSKVLSPIINNNVLFSEDIVYSTNSPLNDLVHVGYVEATFGSSSITVKDASNVNQSVTLVVGDKLFAETHTNYGKFVKLIGTVASNATSHIHALQGYSRVNCGGDTYANKGIFKLYKAKKNGTTPIKNLVFNKALASNILVDSVTSLSGTSDKGLYFTAGSSLDSTGLEQSSLVNASASTDARAVGYHISKVEGDINGADYQCVLGNGQATETHENIHMPNTLIDYSVLNITEIGSYLDVEIAPYVPLTLGRLEINLANDYDATPNTIGQTVITIAFGEEANYIWMQGLIQTTGVKRGDSCFIDGVFKGIIMDEHINSIDSVIVLDRKIRYITGQTVTTLSSVTGLPKSAGTLYDDKDTHELELINVGHLHGGKMISHIQFYKTFSNFGPLDVQLKYTDSLYTSFQKYGSPLYSIYSLEKGDEINYAATYKLNTQRNDLVKSRRRYSSTHSHLPIEGRGYFTPTFSNFDDKQIGVTPTKTYTYPFNFVRISDSIDRDALNDFNTARAKDLISHRQKSVDRMFIFANSDETPYHDRRPDSLANSALVAKDISKYNIVGLLPTTSSNSEDAKANEITTTRHTNVDGDYSTASIVSSDKNLNALMNVGIMRLTEVVVDWSFNQIDPEKELPETTIPSMSASRFTEVFTPVNLDGDVQYYLQSGSYAADPADASISFYTAASGGSPVNFASITGSNPLIKYDALVTDDSNNFLIGFMNNTNSLISFIRFANWNKSAYYTGPVKKISKANYLGSIISGRGSNNSFMAADVALERFKGGIFNSPAFESNQKYVTINNNSVLPIHAHSATDGTPAPSENWFAHQFYDENGNRTGYFFWFNVETPSHGNVDTIPDIFATDFTGQTGGTPHHPTGIDYTAIEIQLVDGYTEMQFHAAIAGAYDSVNLRTNHVYGGDTANDSNAANYGGSLATQWRTKRGAVEDTYLVETSAVANHGVVFTIAKVNVDITADGVGWGKTSSAYHGKWGETLGGIINNYASTPRIGGIYLPISIANNFSSIQYTYSDTMNRLLNSPLSTSYADISANNSNEMLYKNFVPVALGNFKIEDAKDKKQVSVGESFPMIEGVFRREHAGGSPITIFGLISQYSTWFNKYEYYLDFGSTKQENADLPDEGAGIKVGFKPRLKGTHATLIAGTYREGSGSTVYPYSFETTNTDVAWLLDLDLTGCYLLRISNPSQDNNIFTDGLGLTYVISHEVNPSDPSKVILTLDNTLGPTNIYRILQPNHTTFYDFSPTDINIGYISSSYTKKPNADACYGDLKSHATTDGSMEQNDSINDMEAIGSMYVLVDLAGKVNSDHRLINNSMSLDFWNTLPSKVCLSDGETTFSAGLTSAGYNLKFSSLQKLKGITSMSEIMKVKVNKNFNKESKRCLIGNTVDIVAESEKIATTLLENENIELTIKNEPTYPLFTAPNFQGQNLLSAARYLLNKKDREIEIIDGKFVIDTEDASNKYAKVLLSENGKYKIFEYEKQKTNFNLYNEITVYGSSHKSVKKDLRSIKELGRKTLEVFEDKLLTQDEVDKEARELLRLHSKLNESYKVTVATKGLEQLRSGDIIQFELVRENIERNEYIVLSISHRLTGLMELELGKYAESLDDRLVDIIRQGKETKSYLRNEKFNENESSIEILDTINIKEIRTLIRKRTTSGNPLTLGFGTNLNTSTVQLGFEGGQTIVITNLQEKLL